VETKRIKTHGSRKSAPGGKSGRPGDTFGAKIYFSCGIRKLREQLFWVEGNK